MPARRSLSVGGSPPFIFLQRSKMTPSESPLDIASPVGPVPMSAAISKSHSCAVGFYATGRSVYTGSLACEAVFIKVS
jgi:hypothetical protein